MSDVGALDRKSYWGESLSFATWERRMQGYRRWYVATGVLETEGIQRTKAQIVIPIEQIEGMSDEEIGREVRAMLPLGHALYAFNLARDLLEFRKKILRDWREHNNYVVDVRNVLLRYKDYPYRDKSNTVKRAIRLADEVMALVAGKEKARTTKRYARAAAVKDFDALFVAVGRRDGFRCAACESVENLQLDHIHPVGLGGETHLDNLQLLCKPCNLRKGERTIDYRGTQQSEEIQ